MAAGSYKPDGIDPTGIRKILRMLDSLRTSPAGNLIYRQVEGLLDDIASSHLRSEVVYAGFINVLLDAYCNRLPEGSSQYLQLRLLQARMQPPLTPVELEKLSEFINQVAEQIEDNIAIEPALLNEALKPLLSAFRIGKIEPLEVKPELQAEEGKVQSPGAAERPAEIVKVQAATVDDEAIADNAGNQVADETNEELELTDVQAAARKLVEEDEDVLELKRRDIQQLQTALGEQVHETISQNEEFGVILEVVLAELRQSDEKTELEDIRWTLVREVEKLMKGHNSLADKLDSTSHYLQLVETDSRELTDELSRVRMLSLTDELTSLPNRRAFIRRLEDEVARVQRYGFPLSFALMDLDHFKQVNDEFGHAAGDEVLRVYSKNILSVFRHHDMVSRYGGEEFAVLLPNTDSDGAIRALNKVKRRAAETRWQCNGSASQVPSFSAGVSLYKPGESAAAFIERADKALYRAKRLGRNRVELDMTYQAGSGDDSPRRRSTDT
jgi:diguanylate cyclase (GGDEF)-like protein